MSKSSSAIRSRVGTPPPRDGKNGGRCSSCAQKVSDRLVELAKIKAGDRVLDIATGTGEPAITAARKVGPNGRVIGTDHSPGMLEVARRRAASLGLTNVEYRAG